jgi:hypothetical protein
MQRLEKDKFVLPQLADIIRHMAAMTCDENIVNVVDMDTIFLQKAVPPKMLYGHAAGTFMLNPCSFENKNMLAKTIKRMRDYCQYPKDNLKVATPVRYVRQRM